jgi:hypothetical protein
VTSQQRLYRKNPLPGLSAERRLDAGVVGMTERSTAEPSAERWEDTFLQILDGDLADPSQSSQSKMVPPGMRVSGFVVLAAGATSLQEVQDLCAGRTARRCLTVRYNVGRAPLPGSLLAAFAADLATLGAGQAGVVGQFSPQPSADSPWASMADQPATVSFSNARDFAVERTGAHLDGRWLDLFGNFARQVLTNGDQLVLLAEALDDPWLMEIDGLRLLAARLPASCGLVLSAPGSERPTELVDPSFAVLRMPGTERPGRPSAVYKDVELTGDQVAAHDALDRFRYAQSLATLCTLPATGPMTIGIHAPWGAGKSSFMRFVEWHLIQRAIAGTVYGDLMEAGLGQALNKHRLLLRWPLLALSRRPLSAELLIDYLSSLRVLDLIDPSPTSDAKVDVKATGLTRLSAWQLRRHVTKRMIPIWFNAWQYEGANQIWAGLTHQITQGMERSMTWWGRMTARIGYAIRRRGAQFWLGVVAPLAVAALVAAATIKLGLGGKLAEVAPGDVKQLAARLPATLVVIIGALFVATRFFKRVKPVSEGLLDYVRQPNYRDHMGYQHQVLEDIRYLTGRLRRRGKAPRIFVFIDDLDRCSDEKVLEALQAINLLLTASGCYVFLGIDTDMIIRAIQRHFDFEGDSQEKARSYLRKILQINLRLHAPDSRRTLDFLGGFFTKDSRDRLAEALAATGSAPAPDEPLMPWNLADVTPPAQFAVRLDEVKDTVHELWAFHQLADLVPTNPREMKRLVNVHRLVRIIIRSAGVHPSASEQRLLVGWLLFCFEAPRWAARLVAQARAEDTDQPIKEARLEAILERLDDDPTQPSGEAVPARLTVAQLRPGTAYSEAWEISSLFRMSE